MPQGHLRDSKFFQTLSLLYIMYLSTLISREKLRKPIEHSKNKKNIIITQSGKVENEIGPEVL